MHDALGRELKKGDLVLIPARITNLSATEDFCNVEVESTLRRRPDGQKERVSAINTGVLVRWNAGDNEALERPGSA